MNADAQQVRSLFLAAVENHAPGQWAAYLDVVCAGDPAMRRRVEVLLRAHQQSNSLLDAPAPNPVATVEEMVGERPGTVIGPYKLLEQIGEGGFGVVFMAEQTQPVRRRVALKIIKPGMDTRQVVARFEAERQALALMDHPNIAHIFDGGETISGRPYFVMELVRGVPITEFCDQNHLPVRERLELFVNVCQAVQHAHQKGIIHRDLKPTNILVTLHDDKPVVKVIDFGIAKATGQQLTDKTLFTGFAQMVGTPLYMSPEQAGMSGLDVDTRSDIYSLGVVLYELLTGTTPFDKERLRAVGYDEMRRIIREEEPPRPSTRMSTLGQARATVSANRQSEPYRLSQLFRGELDWIVMRALEKDRNRRYETASAFAADVLRYLHDEPVLACPPSAWYHFRKFARRNKAALAATGLILSFLLALGGGVGWVVRDREARRSRTSGEVTQFLRKAESFYRDGKLPEALAEAEKARGLLGAGDGTEEARQQVRDWLADLDMALALEELRLDAADRKIGAMHSANAALAFRVDPEKTDAGYARLFREYGIDVDDLSSEEAATRIAARRVRADLVAALDDWAWRLTDRPKHQPRWQQLVTIARAAEPDPWRERLREAVARRDRKALQGLAASADLPGLRTPAVELLANALLTVGDRETAISLLRKVWQQRPGDFRVNFFLGLYLSPPRAEEQVRGRWDAALPFFTAAVATNPRSRQAHFSLGRAFLWSGALDEAIPAFREAIRLMPNPPNADDVAAASCAHQLLAIAWQRKGAFAEAIAVYRQGVLLKPDDTWSVGQIAYLARRLATHPDANARNPALAVEAAKEAVALVPKDRSSWEFWDILGTAYYRAGNWKAAAEALERSLELRAAGESPGSFFLAMTYCRLGRKEAARKHYERMARWMDRNQPRDEELRRFRSEAEAVLGLKKK